MELKVANVHAIYAVVLVTVAQLNVEYWKQEISVVAQKI